MCGVSDVCDVSDMSEVEAGSVSSLSLYDFMRRLALYFVLLSLLWPRNGAGASGNTLRLAACYFTPFYRNCLIGIIIIN